jgi:elongation factor P
MFDTLKKLLIDELQIDPAAITMEVAEAPEGVKGNSANNVYKSATMTTGLVVQVPLFITAGQRISVKTEDGTYLGRVNN